MSNFRAGVIHTWEDGQDIPEVCLGQAPENPTHFKVFKYRRDLEAAGYLFIPGTVTVHGSWADYIQMRLDPPNPDQLREEQWFDYLDKLDEASRQRREQVPLPDSPAGKSPQDVAEWVARKHMLVDTGIREVRYLPAGAPPDEIRLLELNDRLPGPETSPEPLDWGLDVDGAQFRLCVADVTSEQMEQIQRDPSRLPAGWSFEGTIRWSRSA